VTIEWAPVALIEGWKITPGEHGDASLETFTVERHWFGDSCDP